MPTTDPNPPVTPVDTTAVTGNTGPAPTGTASTASNADTTVYGGGGGTDNYVEAETTIDTSAVQGGSTTPTSTAMAGTPDTQTFGSPIVHANPAYRAPGSPVAVSIRDTTWTDSPVSGTVLVTNKEYDKDTTTATLTTPTAHHLSAGQTILVLTVDDDLNGYHLVDTVPTDTTLTFQTDLPAADIVSAAVVGGYLSVQTMANMSSTPDSYAIGAVAQGSTDVTDAPTAVSAVANNDGTVTVSWTAPTPIVGSPTTSFMVESDRGVVVLASAAATSVVVEEWRLEPEVATTFTVRATNRNGQSEQSTASGAVTPRNTVMLGYGGRGPLTVANPVYLPDGSVLAGSDGMPGVPRSVTLTDTGSGTATVDWLAPTLGTADGGYRVTIYTNGVAASTTDVAAGVLTKDLTGLTGTTQVTVSAKSVAYGVGVPSALTSSVHETAPGVPTDVAAEAGEAGELVVTWALPATGAPFTAFRVTPSEGTPVTVNSPTATTATVTGLTTGHSVTATVRASNANGNSAESTASNAVTIG